MKVLFMFIIISLVIIVPVYAVASSDNVATEHDVISYIISAIVTACVTLLAGFYKRFTDYLKLKREKYLKEYEEDKKNKKLWAKMKVCELIELFVAEAERKFKDKSNPEKANYVTNKVVDNLDPEVSEILNQNNLSAQHVIADNLHKTVKAVKQGKSFHLGTFLKGTAVDIAVNEISKSLK